VTVLVVEARQIEGYTQDFSIICHQIYRGILDCIQCAAFSILIVVPFLFVLNFKIGFD